MNKKVINKRKLSAKELGKQYVKPRSAENTARIIFLSIFGFFVLIAILAFLPGHIKYWIAEIKCGGSIPYSVRTSSSFMGISQSYDKPSDAYTVSLSNEYYCTEQEVIDLGLDHDSYVNPR